MIVAARPRVDRLVRPPVAGIRMVHELHLPIRFTEPNGIAWPGSREIDVPITIRHLLGDDSVSGFTKTLDADPWQTFFRDDAGQTAIRFHRINERMPPATLRTVQEGTLYEMRYPEVPDGDVDQRGREQLIVTIALPTRGRGVLVHACGIRLSSGQVVLCPGVSGRGKSTLARLVQQSRGGATVISDDRCIVTVDNDQLRVWGTPWPGDANAADSVDGPLAAVVLIGRSSTPKLTRATPADVAHVLLETVVLPLWQSDLLETTLGLVDRLTQSSQAHFFEYPTVPASAEWFLEQLHDVARVSA